MHFVFEGQQRVGHCSVKFANFYDFSEMIGIEPVQKQLGALAT
jgi:hypothetical protein